MFYAVKDKIQQDVFILKFCSVQRYKLRLNVSENVPVCQKTFLNVLHITQYRISCKKSILNTGQALSEKRDGDRKTAKF